MLMRLPIEPLRHALGIAGVQSAHLRQSRVGELSHWKGCAFAGAARHGVFAAMLAREGITGPAPIFEGANGFEKLVSGPLKLAGPFSDSGEAGDFKNFNDFMILKTSIKFWPAEYHAQSAVEASLELRPQIENLDEITQIVVESHDAAVDIIGSGAERWRPTSRETADHSLPYMVGAAIADGELTARQFEPDRLKDEKLLALIAKIQIRRHSELSQRYAAEVGNIVTISLKSGRTLSRRVDIPIGYAARPLTDGQVETKFHALADTVIGSDRANAIADWVWRLDTQRDFAELMELLVVP
jgi:2-methylcitrate dehydratase